MDWLDSEEDVVEIDFDEGAVPEVTLHYEEGAEDYDLENRSGADDEDEEAGE